MQNLNSCANIALHFITLAGVFMRKIISLICILLPILTYADEVVLRENAPDQYVVVKGDTLWDISNKFFKDPWKWPQIWGFNKDTIKDPHWIYPGNVVYLDKSNKTLHFGEVPKSPSTPAVETALVPALPPSSESMVEALPDASPAPESNIQKLSPRIRVLSGDHDALPSIPASAIGAFLNKPLVIETEELEGAPVIIGSVEQRALLSFGDTAFAKGIPSDKGANWQLYRPGKALIDPDTNKTLGYEAIYLGDTTVQKQSQITTLKITKSVLDIQKGDNLIQSSVGLPNNYIPRAPSNAIKGKVISIYGGVDQGGQNSIITINRGKRDGIENGHVLALYKESEVSKFKGEKYTLPALRYGLIFVFRTFDKVAYALVMEVQRPVQLLDTLETP